MTEIAASSSAPSDHSPRKPGPTDVLQQQVFALRAQLVASLEQIDGILGQLMVIAPDQPMNPTTVAQATDKLRQAQGGKSRDPSATFGGDDHGSSSSP